ncbi:leucine rich repeat domain containing protein, partial [Acanthamoeba castellanii str. Neff]
DPIVWVGLDLSSVGLVGSIPASWSRFCTLTTLALKDNYLVGTLPAFGSEMAFPRLQYLSLQQNLFHGPLPDYYGNLGALQGLFLGPNNLSSSVPASLGCLPNLEFLQLSNNLFSGCLPEIFSNSPLLVLLVLSYNQLNGTIPQALVRHPSLQVLLLDANNFEGEIPKFPQFTSPLTVLDVSGNVKLSGTIGDDLIASAPSLAYISVKGNLRMRLNPNTTLHWFGFDQSALDVSDRRVYYCPSAASYSPYYFRISTSPEFYGYQYCRCADGYYGAPPHDCGLCPVNCACTMGKTLSWKRGFYPILNNHSQVTGAMPCTDYGSNGQDSACNPKGSCSAKYGQGVDSSCVMCSPGTEGRLCSHCMCASPSDCFFRSGSRCIQCSEAAIVGFTLGVCVFVLGAVVLLVAMHVWRDRTLLARLRKAAREVGDSGALKIFLVFAQTTAMLNATWPEWVLSRGMRYLDLFNASTDGTGIECLLNWMSDPVWNLATFFLVIPLATALIVLIVLARMAYLWRRGRLGLGTPPPPADVDNNVYPVDKGGRQDDNDDSVGRSYVVELTPRLREEEVLLASRRSRDKPAGRPWYGGIYAWLWVVWFLLFELTNRSLAVFDCVDEPHANSNSNSNSRFMASLPWLRCSSDTDWGALQKLSVASIVICVFGIPLLFTALLFFQRRRLDEPRTRHCLGGLFACYRPTMRWFELALTARRLALPALLSLVASTNPVRPAAIMLVLLVALTLQHCLVPFASATDNLLEEAAIGTVAFTFATQTLWKAFNQLNSLSAHDDRPLIVEWNDFDNILTVADDYAYLLVSLVLVLNLVMLVVLLFFALRPLRLPMVSALRLLSPFASSSSSSSPSPADVTAAKAEEASMVCGPN